MKIKFLAAILLLAVIFSGCSDSLSGNTDIMRPPRVTGDKAGIQNLIEMQAGGKYIYKYPQSGEYRSAITMKDIDGDGTDEAIAIFVADSNQNTIQIMFMKETAGEWSSMGCFNCNCSGVMDIMFADLNGDGMLETLIGFSNYGANSNQLIMYYMKNNSMEYLSINKPYTDILIDDFTGSGMDEIMLLSLSDQNHRSIAQIVKCDKNREDYIAINTYTNPEIVSYSKVTYGVITAETENKKEVYGVVIDGVKLNGNLSTEIVYWDSEDSRLRSTYNAFDEKFQFQRNTQTISKDINDDGVLEIPYVSPMKKEKGEADENICNEIVWMAFDANSEKFVKTLDTVVNYTDGYYFIIPVAWQDNISVRYDAQTRTMNFYEWNNNRLQELLLSIQAFSDKEWEEEEKEYTFVKIASAKNTVYGAYVYKTVNTDLTTEIGEVTQNFELITNN